MKLIHNDKNRTRTVAIIISFFSINKPQTYKSLTNYNVTKIQIFFIFYNFTQNKINKKNNFIGFCH